MRTKQILGSETARRKRAAVELEQGMRLLLTLRDSLKQSRNRGIPLTAAKRRLAQRLKAEEAARGGVSSRKVNRHGRGTR